MGLQLPGEVAYLLNMLGYTWPTADETVMFGMGGEWTAFSADVGTVLADADSAAQFLASVNSGEGLEAFLAQFAEEEGPQAVLADLGQASHVTGAALQVMAGVVLALKITVIIQLLILAYQIAVALAAAGPTFGASMAWIPVAKKIADMGINLAINLALEALLA